MRTASGQICRNFVDVMTGWSQSYNSRTEGIISSITKTICAGFIWVITNTSLVLSWISLISHNAHELTYTQNRFTMLCADNFGRRTLKITSRLHWYFATSYKKSSLWMAVKNCRLSFLTSCSVSELSECGSLWRNGICEQQLERNNAKWGNASKTLTLRGLGQLHKRQSDRQLTEYHSYVSST